MGMNILARISEDMGDPDRSLGKHNDAQSNKPVLTSILAPPHRTLNTAYLKGGYRGFY